MYIVYIYRKSHEIPSIPMYICRQDLVVPEGPLRVPRPAKPPPVDREGHPEHLRVPWLWNLGDGPWFIGF